MSPRKDPEPLSRKAQDDDDEDISISKTTLRDQILSALKARNGGEMPGFLDQITQEDVLAQKVTLQVPFNVRDGFLEKGMTTWVDKMFDHFNNYVYEFNPAVRGTELEITFSRPEIVTEQVISNRYRDPDKVVNMFVGRLATRSWTLLVRGQKEKIEAFIVPSDRVIGLTRNQSTYRPYLLLESLFSTGKVFWKQNGQFVKLERLEELTRELFTALIRFARGELTEDHVLAEGNADVPLMVPEAPPAPEPNRSAERKTSEFEEQFFRDAAAEAEARRKEEEAAARRAQSQSGRFKVKDAVKEVVAAKAEKKEKEEPPTAKAQRSTGGNPKLASAQAAAAASAEMTEPAPAAEAGPQPAAKPVNEGPVAAGPYSALPAEEPAKPQAAAPSSPPAVAETHQHMPPPHGPHREPHVEHAHHHPGAGQHATTPIVEAAQNPPQPNQPAPADTKREGDRSMTLETAATNVTLACDILLKSVDNELENVTRSGADAFKNMDLDKVQKSMKQTLKLKAFREKVLTLLSDWSAANAED